MSRVSPYDPAYCDQIIAWGVDGGSIEAFAGEIGVGRQTLYDWKRDHPEFAEAANISVGKALVYWEKQLKGQASGTISGGNAAAAIFGVKNRAGRGEDGKPVWREMTATEVSGPDGGPVATVTKVELVAG